MPDVNLVRVNGVPYSWTSCAFFCNAFPYKGIVGVDYEESREIKVVHAAQQDGTPLGATSGLYKVDSFSLRMLRESANSLMIDLTVLGAGSIGDANWVFNMMLYEPALEVPPAVTSTVTITGCRIVGISEKQEVGVDELVTEFKIQPQLLLRSVGGVPITLWSTIRSLLP